MTSPTPEQIHVALRGDLKKIGSKKDFGEVVNDVLRKIFTARRDGAIYEFAHRQPDAAFWSGVKYYGSGTQSRIRFPRTPAAIKAAKAAKVRPKSLKAAESTTAQTL